MRVDRLRCRDLVILLALLLFAGRAESGILAHVMPRLYILAVGINTYAGLSVTFAREDAEALARAFKSNKMFAGVDAFVLGDNEASRDAIEETFEKIAGEASPNDLFVFFFAGVSVAEETRDQEFYLVPAGVSLDWNSDHSRAEILAAVRPKSISGGVLKAWCLRIQARHQLILLDANFTDRLVTSLTAKIQTEGTELLELGRRRMEVFGSIGLSRESSGCRHGVLTCQVLKGLRGEADAFPRDGRITAEELEIFVRSRLLVGGEGFPSTMVAASNIGGDFPLAAAPMASSPAAAGTQRGFQRPDDAPPQKALGSDPAPGRNYALLIATDEYDSWPHLSNPVSDARAIDRELHDIYGFKTQLVENPTMEQMIALLREYLKMKFGDDDQLLIFIAGHGAYDELTDEGFTVARDSPRNDSSHIKYISHNTLRDIAEHIKSKHILVVLDVCFGGAFDGVGSHRGNEAEYAEISVEQFTQRKMKYTTRLYLTSGGREYVPDGRPGQHSPFARKFLEALRSDGGRRGYLTVGAIKEYLEKITPEPRGGEFGSNEPGSDFVLVPKLGQQ